jgi:hypothetical protein
MIVLLLHLFGVILIQLFRDGWISFLGSCRSEIP